MAIFEKVVVVFVVAKKQKCANLLTFERLPMFPDLLAVSAAQRWRAMT